MAAKGGTVGPRLSWLSVSTVPDGFMVGASPYLAGQLRHLSGQSDVWAVGQRTSAAGLLTGLLTVADLTEQEQREHNTHNTSIFLVFTLELFHSNSLIAAAIICVEAATINNSLGMYV